MEELGKEEKLKSQQENSVKPYNNNKGDERESLSSQMSDINDVNVIQFDKDEDANADLTFKVIIIGNASVGKSSLIERGTKNIFTEDYNATIGFEYFSFYVKHDNKIIKLQVWDTCGQEIYQSLITNFYRNSSLAILVYAINDTKSFENLEDWLKDLRKESNPDAKIILIGNKVDLESEREISYEEAEKYAKDYNFSYFFETSAKTGFNAQKVFINAALTLYEDYLKYKTSESSSENISSSFGSSKLTKESKKSKKKKEGHCC